MVPRAVKPVSARAPHARTGTMSKDVEMKEANGQQAAPKKKEEEKGEGEKAKALPKDVLRVRSRSHSSGV